MVVRSFKISVSWAQDACVCATDRNRNQICAEIKHVLINLC